MKRIIIMLLFLMVMLCGCQKNDEQEKNEANCAYLTDVYHELSTITSPGLNSSKIISIEAADIYFYKDSIYPIAKYLVSYNEFEIQNLFYMIQRKYYEVEDYYMVGSGIIVNVNHQFGRLTFRLNLFVHKDKPTDECFGFTQLVDGKEKIYLVCKCADFYENFEKASDYYYAFCHRTSDVYDNDYNYVTTLLDYDTIRFKEVNDDKVDYSEAKYLLFGGCDYMIYLIDSKTFYISTKRYKYATTETYEATNGPYFDMSGKYYRIISNIDDLFE